MKNVLSPSSVTMIMMSELMNAAQKDVLSRSPEQDSKRRYRECKSGDGRR